MLLKTKKIKNNQPQKIVINQTTNYHLIDIDSDIDKIEIIFEINASCNIILSSFTFNKNKCINLLFKLNESNCDIKITVNSLTINHKNTDIQLKAINTKDINNVNIDMQINAITSSANSTITCLPIFEFTNNKINATHGLIIGSFKDEEIFYLMNKGIKSIDAKAMLVWSKFNEALINISSKEKNIYYDFILSKWRKN